MKDVRTACLLAAVILVVGCKTFQPFQSRSELTEREFGALLERTADKMDRFASGEKIQFLPEEKTALMCLIQAEVFSIFGRDLPNSGSSKFFLTEYSKPLGNEIDVYAKVDMDDLDKALIARIFSASFDTVEVIKRQFEKSHSHVDSLNIIYKSLPAKQKNALLAAHLIRLSGITDFNATLLSVWRDESIAHSVRDVCMSVALSNCDEATYRAVRDELLDNRLLPAQKAALLFLAGGSGNPYSILLHIFAYEYAEEICRGKDKNTIDYLRCQALNGLDSFNSGIGMAGLKGWICNRDYLTCAPETYIWSIDLKSKYADAGIICNERDIHIKPFVVSKLLDAFDAKTLFDRTGLTSEQFIEIPTRQLLVWDKLSKKQRERLIKEADKKLGEKAQRKPSSYNPIDAEDAREFLRYIDMNQYRVLQLFEEFRNGKITDKQLADKIIRVQKMAALKAQVLKFDAAEKGDSAIAETILMQIWDVMYDVENNDLESAEKTVRQLRLFLQNAQSP